MDQNSLAKVSAKKTSMSQNAPKLILNKYYFTWQKTLGIEIFTDSAGPLLKVKKQQLLN